jgi:hypothetical protein
VVAEDDVSEKSSVRSVYPDVDQPEPIAVKLCDALHTLPMRRKAECCSTSVPAGIASECVRGITVALRDKSIALDAADVDRCVADSERATQGCDWVTPLMSAPPESCRKILKGQLDANKKCRSSIECKPGLQCKGVGPTAAGLCSPPSANGAPCGLAVDFLGTYGRQLDFEVEHPECEGACKARTCVARTAKGTACTSSKQCEAGLHCVGKVCVEGEASALGEPCMDRCASGAICIAQKCVMPKAAGEACTSAFECQAGCVKEAGRETGTCGKLCFYPIVQQKAPPAKAPPAKAPAR